MKACHTNRSTVPNIARRGSAKGCCLTTVKSTKSAGITEQKSSCFASYWPCQLRKWAASLKEYICSNTHFFSTFLRFFFISVTTCLPQINWQTHSASRTDKDTLPSMSPPAVWTVHARQWHKTVETLVLWLHPCQQRQALSCTVELSAHCRQTIPSAES